MLARSGRGLSACLTTTCLRLVSCGVRLWQERRCEGSHQRVPLRPPRIERAGAQGHVRLLLRSLQLYGHDQVLRPLSEHGYHPESGARDAMALTFATIAVASHAAQPVALGVMMQFFTPRIQKAYHQVGFSVAAEACHEFPSFFGGSVLLSQEY